MLHGHHSPRSLRGHSRPRGRTRGHSHSQLPPEGPWARDLISCLIWVDIGLATLCVSLGATRSPRKPSCLGRSVAVVLIKLVTLSKSSKDSGFLRHIHPFFGHTPKYKLWSGGFGIAKVATASRGLLLEVTIMEDLTNHE